MEHYVLTHYDLAMMAYLLQANMGTRHSAGAGSP